MALLLQALEVSQIEIDAASCRKRAWESSVDSDFHGCCTPSDDEREHKMHRYCSLERCTDVSPEASAFDQSLSATSCGSACWEDDGFADQFCVSETIKSLEAELGIRTEQEASSCSRNEDRHGNCSTLLRLSDPCSAKSEVLSREDETGDSLADSCCSAYSESSFADDAIPPEPRASDYPQLDYSFLWEILDDQLGLLQNLSSEHLQAFTRYQEAETICSFQSLTEDISACAHLDEDIWGF